RRARPPPLPPHREPPPPPAALPLRPPPPGGARRVLRPRGPRVFRVRRRLPRRVGRPRRVCPAGGAPAVDVRDHGRNRARRHGRGPRRALRGGGAGAGRGAQVVPQSTAFSSPPAPPSRGYAPSTAGRRGPGGRRQN